MKKFLIDHKGIYKEVLQTLLNGGVVMHPTETCYGLAVDIFNKGAVEKLYSIKEMEMDKPTSVLVTGLEMAREYGEFSDAASELVEKYWPGPLSVIVPRTPKLPKFFNPGNDFISMRWSDMDFCTQIVKDLRSPVTTTSANISSEPSLYKVDGESDILNRVDLIVDGGEIEKNAPSTLVKVVGGELEVLRKGGLIVDV